MFLLLLACREPGGPPADSPLDSPVDPGPFALPAACEPGGATARDNLIAGGALQVGPQNPFMEILDLEWSGNLVYAVGQGGLAIYDVSGDVPALLSMSGERFHRVELLGGDRVAVTHRDRGLQVFDVSDPARPKPGPLVGGRGMEGMLLRDGVLTVSVRGEGLRAYDPDTLALLESAPGLDAPWELSPGAVADGALGVVPWSSAPLSVGEPYGLPAFHVVEADGVVWAASGEPGVIAYRDGVEIGRAVSGGTAVMSAVDGDLLWVVDHDAVAVFDISDPTAPRPLAHQRTAQFALAVRAAGGTAWVGDWNWLESWIFDGSSAAPAIDLPGDSLRVPAEVSLHNRGGADLHLLGATGGGALFGDDVIAPGQSTTLRLDQPGILCIASDDPDDEVLQVELVVGDERLGQPAPDFTLTDLEGNSWRLAELLGRPVVLDYFATW